MSESVWQNLGYNGTLADVEAARLSFSANPDVGGMLPEIHLPPYQLLEGEDSYIFGIVARGDIPTPDGLKLVKSNLVYLAMGGTSF